MKIIGIDPGSYVAGFAVLESTVPAPVSPRQFAVRDVGVWRFKPKTDHAARIGLLHDMAFALFTQHGGDVCVLEKAFGGINISSALKLGEARGAVVAAAGRAGIMLSQIAPTSAKKTVAGKGNASKEDVALSLKLLIGFERSHLPHDATDALCLALSFGLTDGMGGLSTFLARAEMEKR